MKQSNIYPNIDMIQTGFRLKCYIDESKMSVKDIQEYLHLSCPQPVYRWIKGMTLPTVDHLLALSELFGVHMEELLVRKQDIFKMYFGRDDGETFEKRISMYFRILARRCYDR